MHGVLTAVLLPYGVCRCVCIVYDPQKSGRGQVSVKAIRLKDAFITLFKEGKLTGMHTTAAAADLAEQYSKMPCRILLASAWLRWC